MSSSAAQPLTVLGRKKPAGSVTVLDFDRPRRMAPERMRELSVLLENHLPTLQKRLELAVGLQLRLTLEGLGERDAERLFDGAQEPLCVLRFRAADAPGWLVWDPAAAVGLIETIFGGRAAEPTARRLSPTESTVAAHFMAEVVHEVAGPLGLEVTDPALVHVLSELGSWREGGGEAQSHRLEIRLGLERDGQKSTLHLYTPGVGSAGAEPSGKPLPQHLPGHLDQVEIEVSARLRGCEISLDQLLALEEGDVIPLEARVGDPTDLCVDGMTLAEGRLGSHRGRLAVRIERLKVLPETLR